MYRLMIMAMESLLQLFLLSSCEFVLWDVRGIALIVEKPLIPESYT